MNFFKRFLGGGPERNRVFVLGLEGVAWDFARWLAAEGVMPNLAAILPQGAALGLAAPQPAVNSVAWATYATGVNPGRHGVFGFVDREPNPFGIHLPNSRDLKVPPFWQALSRAGKQAGIVNLPLTYPPQPLNGFLVADSQSPELAKATYPVELAPRLMEMDYRLSADPALLEHGASAFLAELSQVMANRFAAAFALLKSQGWDFFHLHLSSPDVANYFFWTEAEGFADDFLAFYRKLDQYLGELMVQLPRGARLALLSANGFSAAKALIYLNRWLEENGYLLFGRGKKSLAAMHQESRAYSLVPGRIYLNLQGREERGSVPRGKAYEDLREELIHRLGNLAHPQTGEPLVERVWRREELYQGPHLNLAADLLVEPKSGFDLRANLDGPGLLAAPDMPGIHARQGGFLHLAGIKTLHAPGGAQLMDVAPTMLKLLEVPAPPEMEGRALL